MSNHTSDSKKIIALNLQPIASGNLTGIGFYARNVVMGLMKDGALMCGGEQDFELHAFDFLGRNKADATIEQRLGMKPTHMSKIMPLGAYIRLGKLGKILPYEALLRSKAQKTLFFNYLVPQGLKGESVITIYDLVCERFPETMEARNRTLLKKHLRASSQKADKIVTISAFSKSEIIELLGVPEDKIVVAPCGVDSSFYNLDSGAEDDEKIIKELVEGPYILYVGTLEPRKNIKKVVELFERVCEAYPDLKLVIAGGVGWQPEETLAAIDASKVKDKIVRTGYISEEQKRALYRGSELFVFPSLYEGFGMPVVEAMACGTKVVASNSSSIPEVAGGLATLVDPNDSNSILEGILAELRRGKLSLDDKQKLSAKAHEFTWENAVEVWKKLI